MLQLFKNGKSPEVLSTTTLEDVLNEIRTGGSHKTYVEGLRLMDKSNPLFDLIKMSQIPSVRFNFQFNKKASNDNIIGPTGYIYIDVDNCTEIKKSDFITACWKSVSGTGLGILVKVEGLTVDNYRSTYNKVTEILGVNSDSGARKATQQTILSYDPDVYYNENAESIIAVQVEKKSNKKVYTYSKGTTYENEKIDLKFNEIKEQFSDTDVDYIVYREDKKELCVPHLPKVIPVGKRNKSLFYYVSQVAALNPGIHKGLLYSLAKSANSNTLTPLSETELRTIVNSIHKKLTDGTLKLIKNQSRRVLFDPDKNICRGDKMKVVNKVLGEIKSESTKNKINSALESWDFNSLGKVTKVRLSRAAELHISTIKKYWSVFQDFIETLNLQNIKEAVNEVVTKVKVKISRAFKKAVSIFKTPNTDVSSNTDFYSGNNVTPVPLILQT